MRPRALLALCCGLVMAGCATSGSDEPRPARLIEPDAAVRAELHRVLVEALGERDILLADAALTDTSLLIIERRRHLDPAGRRIDGRSMEMPERFQLVRHGEQCLLVQLSTGTRWPLAGVRCRPDIGPGPGGSTDAGP